MGKVTYEIVKWGDARGVGAIVQETIGFLWRTRVRTWTCVSEPGFEDDPDFDQWVCRETGQSIEADPVFGEAVPAFYRANYNTRNKEETACMTTSTPSVD